MPSFVTIEARKGDVQWSKLTKEQDNVVRGDPKEVEKLRSPGIVMPINVKFCVADDVAKLTILIVQYDIACAKDFDVGRGDAKALEVFQIRQARGRHIQALQDLRVRHHP